MSTTTDKRVTWLDVARGASVLLVVLHHVVRQMVAQAPGAWQPAALIWTSVDEFLTPVRIPLFFFISGLLLASGPVTGTIWASRRRWIVPAYLYVLWSTLLTLRLLLPAAQGQHSFGSNLLGNILLAGSGYWYLYALPLYFIYTRLTDRWPRWLAATPLVLGLLLRRPATEISVEAGHLVMDSSSLLGSIIANGLFFWIGARYGKQIAARIASISAVGIAAAVATFALIQVPAILLNVSDALLPATAVIGIVIGAAVSQRVPQDAPVTSGVRYIGARTLPVYVSQFFFISILSFAWARMASLPFVQSAVWFSWVYPVVVTAIVASISLLGYRLAMTTRALSWLFVPPRWITGATPKK